MSQKKIIYFEDKMKRIQVLKREHPNLVQYLPKIHSWLSGDETDDLPNKWRDDLTSISGLELVNLRTLYKSKFPLAEAPNTTIIQKILRDDPNKVIIETRHSPSGLIVNELLSGR